MVFLVALGGLMLALFAVAAAVSGILAAVGLLDLSDYPPPLRPDCPCAGCLAVYGDPFRPLGKGF